jgi:hypothetical protein
MRKKVRKPGEVRATRIPIYDRKGQQRGHVGPHATGATVARFTGELGAKLGKVKGRDSWSYPK